MSPSVKKNMIVKTEPIVEPVFIQREDKSNNSSYVIDKKEPPKEDVEHIEATIEPQKIEKLHYPDLKTVSSLYSDIINLQDPNVMTKRIDVVLDPNPAPKIYDWEQDFINKRIPLIDTEDDILNRIRDDRLEMLEEEEATITQAGVKLIRNKVKQSSDNIVALEQEKKRREFWANKRTKGKEKHASTATDIATKD
jgi:hypothetical protein